jgi:hypothetical protein
MIRAGASGWSTALTFLALAMAIGPSRFAIAAPDDEALIKQGLERRKRGDDEGALRLFEEAARLSRTGRVMAQIALAEQALGRWADAEVHMVEALSVKADRWIDRNRKVLQDALADISSHLGTLEISGGVAGASVKIDGVEKARLPLERALRLPSGSVALEVAAPGYFPLVRQVVIAPGGRARETVTLAALSASPVVGSSQVEASASPAPERSEDGWSWQTTTGVAALVGGAVFLAVGIVSHVQRQGDVHEFIDIDCVRGSQREECQALESSVNAAEVRMAIGYGAAGALAIGGAVLLLTAPGETNATAGIFIPRFAGGWGLGYRAGF